MWEDQEDEDEEEDEGLTGQLLSDILATNKYGEQSNSNIEFLPQEDLSVPFYHCIPPAGEHFHFGKNSCVFLILF